MNNNKLFIANWKMNLSFKQAINFITSNYDKLVNLQAKTSAKIILCPTYTEIYAVKQIFKNTPICIGAQNCSSHIKGSFTGDVSAITLNDIGCEYCIIGHSESRKNYNETDIDVAKKLEFLIDYGINPIICIGEERIDHEKNKTLSTLEKQLSPIFEKIKSMPNVNENLEISLAYEPIWSIGTGKIADLKHLQTVFAWLKDKAQKELVKINWKTIYGGSINPDNIKMLKKINEIDGFLVGKASLTFQEFEKIIKSDILV